MGRKLHAVNLKSPAQDEVMRPAHLKLDQFALYLSFNDPGLSFEPHLRESSGDLLDKTGETARPVPTHFCFATVTVVISHSKISVSCGGLDQKDAIRADAPMAVTEDSDLSRRKLVNA